MYSTEPIADPNLIHIGFWILFFIYSFIALISFMVSYDVYDHHSEKSFFKQALGFKITLGISITLIFVAAYYSYIVKYPVPKNEVVIAELITDF